MSPTPRFRCQNNHREGPNIFLWVRVDYDQINSWTFDMGLSLAFDIYFKINPHNYNLFIPTCRTLVFPTAFTELTS